MNLKAQHSAIADELKEAVIDNIVKNIPEAKKEKKEAPVTEEKKRERKKM